MIFQDSCVSGRGGMNLCSPDWVMAKLRFADLKCEPSWRDCQEAKTNEEIDRLANGRFVSHHDGGAKVYYYDWRHKIVQCKLESGFVGELVMERTENGYRNQMICVRVARPVLFAKEWSGSAGSRNGPPNFFLFPA